jgi:DNA-directed RNA polymerase subunit omega
LLCGDVGLCSALFSTAHLTDIVNADNCRKALEKVGNPNILINLVSRRVRQLNSPGGRMSRPLVNVTASMGVADIALLEIIEDKITFELPETVAVLKAPVKKRRRSGT